MASLALAFDVLARDKGASKTLDKVADSAERTGKSGQRMGAAMKASMAIMAGAVAAGAGAAVVGMKAAVSEASNLGESINAVQVTFGKASKDILNLSDAAAKSVGLSKSQFNSLAVQFSSFATTVAGRGGDVSKTMGDLTGRAADFASVMNLDVAEAARVFQSGLAGETEPLKRFGIDLSAAAVESYAFANGIAKAGSKLTETQKVQARYGLLMQQTAKTQGDFTNTSDSLANRQRILSAQFDNLKAVLGERLLPVAEKFIAFLQDKALPAISVFYQAFTGNSELNEFEGKLKTVNNVGIHLADFFHARLVPAFRAVSSFVATQVVPRLAALAGFIRAEVIPRIVQFAGFLRGTVWPALQQVAGFLARTFQPTFAALVSTFRTSVMPAFERLRAVVIQNQPQLQALAKFIGTVAVVAYGLYLKFVGFVLPILVKFAGFLFGRLADSITNTIKVIGWLVDKVQAGGEKFKDIRDRAGEFMDKMRAFELPGWVGTLGKALGSIGDGFNAAKKRLSEGVGDGPGRAGAVGGNTLARVKSVLPSGAYVTSTLRSAAQNRAVGGSPSSYHLDRNNPAVDIGGSTAALDQLHARLAAMGGWRELLWRTKGHWDHVHVAHAGGVVSPSWPQMPGWRSDERPARLQVGETVVPKGGGGPLQIEGTLDLGNGLVGMVRGIVRAEGAATARAVASGAGSR